MLDDVVHVLVAAAGEVHQNGVRFRERLREPHGVRHGVRGLQRGDDALVSRKRHERLDGFGVAGGFVGNATRVLQETVLRTHSRIIKPGRDRVHRRGRALLVLQQVTLEPVDGSGRAEGHGGGVLPDDVQVRPRGLHPEHLHLGVVEERGEEADGVAPAPHARHEVVGQVTAGHFFELRSRLSADDGLEIAYHHRERVRTHD